ncbi:helix-turn-helix domain-containing protein [Fundidesulfovibrio agrisoli]|uniref:helix-turn-helix domain-containing protein n=1 Tax=Fundidesulfovibrio agrisoli TaxID=2922717 RepID=UPI001FACEC1F|nr:helix-turn-helix transcriptional regulator [Fundidesulfovibrio agrisoli]
MELRGVTIRQLVAQTGLSSGTLHRARGEQFTKCTLETLATIAGALGVKVKTLFEEG